MFYFPCENVPVNLDPSSRVEEKKTQENIKYASYDIVAQACSTTEYKEGVSQQSIEKGERVGATGVKRIARCSPNRGLSRFGRVDSAVSDTGGQTTSNREDVVAACFAIVGRKPRVACGIICFSGPKTRGTL